ncbi:retrovirus-related pol polyprotein from transposon TNT 1-94 [Tanacetum coccineum]
MAESSSQNPSSPKITPKEEPVTLDKPKSPNPFLHASQGGVRLHFQMLSKESIYKGPTQYKEYLCEFWYTAKTLDDSKIWLSTPTGGIRGDIGYSGRLVATKDLKFKKGFLPLGLEATNGSNHPMSGGKTVAYIKYPTEGCHHLVLLANGVVPYHRFISLLLEYMMPEYDNEELTINLTQVFSAHNWAQNKDQPEGKKPGAKSRLKRKQSSKHTSKSKTEASKSKTGQSRKETQSSLAKDKSPSHPSPPTPVVGEMRKEAQQAAGGPSSLWATSEERSPTLPHPSSGTNLSVLVDQTKSARDRLKTAHTNADTRSAFFAPESPQDEPIIISNESEEEEEVAKDKDTYASSQGVPEDTSIPYPPSPKLAQIQELMAQELLIEVQALPVLVSSVQKQLNTLDSLPSQATASPAEGEKNTTKDAETNLQNELRHCQGSRRLLEDILVSLNGYQLGISLKEITPQLSFNHLAIPQASPDDEEDTRSRHEYLNDLEEEYQARALLAKSKRFFKKGTQRFSSAKATNQTECHKCGKKCHFARDCWSKVSVPSY